MPGRVRPDRCLPALSSWPGATPAQAASRVRTAPATGAESPICIPLNVKRSLFTTLPAPHWRSHADRLRRQIKGKIAPIPSRSDRPGWPLRNSSHYEDRGFLWWSMDCAVNMISHVKPHPTAVTGSGHTLLTSMSSILDNEHGIWKAIVEVIP